MHLHASPSFREVAKMGPGHSPVQEASGKVISQAHVRDGLEQHLAESVTSLDLTHGSADLQGPCIANEEHLSGIHICK